jgi:hypothetical protein
MSSVHKKFIIRSYRSGDEEKINSMFCEVFNVHRSLEHWHWKYRDNPYGSHIISLAETDEGVLAAHYAAYPVVLHWHPSPRIDPQESTIYQIGDKMTRGRFRTAGFGRNALLTHTFMHFKKEFMNPGVAFSYGFLTHHSLRFGLLFLDYTVIEPVFYRRLRFERLSDIPISRLRKVLQQARVVATCEIDDTWTKFFHSVSSHYQYLIRRDAPYLNWRYLQRPDRKYLIVVVKKKNRIAGWSVFYRDGNKIIWGDALFHRNDFDSVKLIMRYLYTHPYARGVDFIECWFPPRPSWWDIMLQTLGFSAETEPSGLSFCITNITDDEASTKLSSSFYYTIGDSDLF